MQRCRSSYFHSVSLLYLGKHWPVNPLTSILWTSRKLGWNCGLSVRFFLKKKKSSCLLLSKCRTSFFFLSSLLLYCSYLKQNSLICWHTLGFCAKILFCLSVWWDLLVSSVASLFISLIKLIVHVNQGPGDWKPAGSNMAEVQFWAVRLCAIGLCSSRPPCKKTPSSSWTLGSRTSLHVENSDPTDSLSPHTRTHRAVCIIPPRPHPGLTVTRPDSCSDRQCDVYWFSGNLLRKSASPHFQICIFKSTLTSVYLCPTTNRQDLLCPNLKRCLNFWK